MNLIRLLWTDEAGVVLSAETVMLGTVGVLAMTAGVGAMSSAMNEELADVSRAFRSFDQSFQVTGYRVDSTGNNASSSSDKEDAAALALKVGSGFQQASAQSTVDALTFEPVAAQVVAPSSFKDEADVEARNVTSEATGKSEEEMRRELELLLREYSRLQALRKEQLERRSGAVSGKSF